MMHNRENEQENVVDPCRQIEENARQAAAQFASITPNKLRFNKNRTFETDVGSNSQGDHNYPKPGRAPPLHVSPTDGGRVSSNNNINSTPKRITPVINNVNKTNDSSSKNYENNYSSSSGDGHRYNLTTNVKNNTNSTDILVNAISNILADSGGDGEERGASSFPSFRRNLSQKNNNTNTKPEIDKVVEKVENSFINNVDVDVGTVCLDNSNAVSDSTCIFNQQTSLIDDERKNESPASEYDTALSDNNNVDSFISNCKNCENLRKEFDDWKTKMLANFQIMKLKVMSTDELISEHHNNYANLENEKKTVKDLKARLEICYGETGALRIQLKKALQANEPLKKTVRRFEYEKSMKQQTIDELKVELDKAELQIGQLKDNTNSSRNLQDNFRRTIEDNLKEHERDKKKIIQQAKLIDKLTNSLGVSRIKQREETKALKKALKDNEKLLSKTLAQQSKILKKNLNLKNISPGKASKKSPIGVLSPSPSPPPTTAPRRNKRRIKKKPVNNDLHDFFNEAFANTDILSTTTSENETDDELNELPKLLTSYSIPTLLSPPLSPIPPSPVLDFVENIYDTMNFPGPSDTCLSSANNEKPPEHLNRLDEEKQVCSSDNKSTDDNLSYSKSAKTCTTQMSAIELNDNIASDILNKQRLPGKSSEGINAKNHLEKRKNSALSKKRLRKIKKSLSKFKSDVNSLHDSSDASDDELNASIRRSPDAKKEMLPAKTSSNDTTALDKHDMELVPHSNKEISLIDTKKLKDFLPSNETENNNTVPSYIEEDEHSEPQKTSSTSCVSADHNISATNVCNEESVSFNIPDAASINNERVKVAEVEWYTDKLENNSECSLLASSSVDKGPSSQTDSQENVFSSSINESSKSNLNEVPCRSKVLIDNDVSSSINMLTTESSMNEPKAKKSMSLDLNLYDKKHEESTSIIENSVASSSLAKADVQENLSISISSPQVNEQSNVETVTESMIDVQLSQSIVNLRTSTSLSRTETMNNTSISNANSLTPETSDNDANILSPDKVNEQDIAGPSSSSFVTSHTSEEKVSSRSQNVDELDSEVASFRLPVQSSLSMDTDESSNQSIEDLPVSSSSMHEHNVVDTSEFRLESQVLLPIDIDESSNLSVDELPVSSSTIAGQENESQNNSPEPPSDSSVTSSLATSASSCNCSVSTTDHSMLWSHPARARQVLGRRYTSFSSGVTTIPTFISPRLRIERTRSLSPTMFSPPSPPLSPIPPSPRRSILTPIISPLPTTPLPESISPLPPSPKITSPPLIRGAALLRTDDPSVFAPKPVSHNTSSTVQVLKFTMESNRNNLDLQRNDSSPARRLDQSRVRARSCSPTFSSKLVRNSPFDRSVGTSVGTENIPSRSSSSFASSSSCNIHSSINKASCCPFKAETPNQLTNIAFLKTSSDKPSTSKDSESTTGAENETNISEPSKESKSPKSSEISVTQQGDACELIKPSPQSSTQDSTIEQRIKSLKNKSNTMSMRRNINMSVDSNNPDFSVKRLGNYLELDLKKKTTTTYSSSTITKPALKDSDVSNFKASTTSAFTSKETSCSTTTKPLSEDINDFKQCTISAFISKETSLTTSNAKLCSSINVSSTNVWRRLDSKKSLFRLKSANFHTADESSDDDCLHIASEECSSQDENVSSASLAENSGQDKIDVVNKIIPSNEDCTALSENHGKPECIESEPPVKEFVSQDVLYQNKVVIERDARPISQNTEIKSAEIRRKRKSSHDDSDGNEVKAKKSMKVNSKNIRSVFTVALGESSKGDSEIEEGEISDDNNVVESNQSNVSLLKSVESESSILSSQKKPLYPNAEVASIVQRDLKKTKKKGALVKLLFHAVNKKLLSKCDVVQALLKPTNLSTLHQLSSSIVYVVKNCDKTLLPTTLKELESRTPQSSSTTNSKQDFNKSHPQAQYISIPVLTCFESDLLSVIISVIHAKNFPNSVKKILNDLQNEILTKEQMLSCERLALCRMFAAICRQYKKIDRLIAFIYALAYDDMSLINFPAVFITFYTVWPAVVSRTNLILQNNESQLDLTRIKISPLSSTLQFIALVESFDRNEILSQNILQKLLTLKWSKDFSTNDNYRKFIFELFSLLSCKQLSYFENNDNCTEICPFAMSTIKAIELLCKRVGWEWTCNFIIYEKVVDQVKTFFNGSSDLHPDTVAIFIRLSGELCRYGVHLKIDLKSFCQLLVNIIEKIVDSDVTMNQVEISIVYALMVLAPTDIDVCSAALKKWIANARRRGIVVPHDFYSNISDNIV